ncbi:adenylate/guanylate cyclase domain-containing protein [Cohnella xylanilytica]|uniref:Adenylate/guanylate cyclase domain-containing protein n=1 Tax=Cohnella xylanilytica TaxID=557555 RepID=A0A841U549_9BACL|nr:adenylate/guanylate cyclase domain-containing protein [Cohnella xylanilytica]MBB6695807.1 adenylate/guanylate cyclase domain-containing protein [Cohnella xylanilytica]
MRERIKRIAIALNAVILVAVFFVYREKWLQSIDNLLFDYGMKQAAEHRSDNIVVVTIDDESLQELGRFPWDRAVYAPFLDMLNQPGYEPKAIAFDVMFNEPSNPDSDAAFAEALSQYDNVILPVAGVTEGDFDNRTEASPDEYLKAFKLDRPIPELAEHAELANINRVVSPDSVIRQTWLKIQDQEGNVVPSLAYKAAQMAGADLSKYDGMTDPRGRFDDKVAAKNTITIDYQFTALDMEKTPVSFVRVLNGEIDPEYFKDAVVLVGFTAAGLSDDTGQDNGATPIQKHMSLVYVHANIVHQLLNGSSVSYADEWVVILGGLLLFALFIVLPWRLKNVYSILAFLAVVCGILYGQLQLYESSKIHVNVVNALLAVTLAYLVNVSLKSYLESSQKSFVTRQFGRYISPDLVKQIISKDIDIELGGNSKHITVLFLDIRGFTPLSEKLSPPELVDTLNTMFNMITQTTLNNRGTIDKFIGDAAMILFNAPLDVEEHERLAVKTAYEIQQGMNVIREQIREKYGCEVNVGIGINSGNVVVGNIGSYLRVDYTAIGDNVNIAARIESSTKPGQIMVSEAVYEKTKESFVYEDAGEKMFKGKSEAIRVYEVIKPAEAGASPVPAGKAI